MQTSQAKSPWSWVPSLYFAQAIPYVAANSLSVVLYKDMGVSNSDIAFYTSLLYLPWVIKPLWSPLVELAGTNPQVAARLLNAFRSWRMMESQRQAKAEAALRGIAASRQLSADVRDIVDRCLS